MICSVFLWKRHFKSPQDRIKTKVRSICVRKKFKSPETVKFQGFLFGGDKRDRTADLLNAIQALSQLSYTPMLPETLDFAGFLSYSIF